MVLKDQKRAKIASQRPQLLMEVELRMKYSMKNLRRMRERIEREQNRLKRRQMFREYEACLAEIDTY